MQFINRAWQRSQRGGTRIIWFSWTFCSDCPNNPDEFTLLSERICQNSLAMQKPAGENCTCAKAFNKILILHTTNEAAGLKSCSIKERSEPALCNLNMSGKAALGGQAVWNTYRWQIDTHMSFLAVSFPTCFFQDEESLSPSASSDATGRGACAWDISELYLTSFFFPDVLLQVSCLISKPHCAPSPRAVQSYSSEIQISLWTLKAEKSLHIFRWYIFVKQT